MIRGLFIMCFLIMNKVVVVVFFFIINLKSAKALIRFVRNYKDDLVCLLL